MKTERMDPERLAKWETASKESKANKDATAALGLDRKEKLTAGEER